ncbi:MAG: hypothetical protein Q4F70_04590 [Clostridia bacterium]|nr:hypothetical protein [Clostridia bacterium]
MAKDKKAEELEELVKELPGEEIPLDVNPEGDDKIPLDPSTGLDPEKLESELNDLKDLVQGEIDKMMEENPDASWKEIVKEAKDGKTKHSSGKLCECCGENEVDDDEQYCESCLETMKHYPFSWWKLIAPIVAIILLILAFSYFAISFSVFKETVSANKLAKAGKLNSALAAYDSINTEIKVTDDNFGGRYLRYQVDLYEKIGIDKYEDLSEFIEKYFTESDLAKSKNKSVKEAKNKIDSYQKLYDCFNDVYNVSMTYDEFEEAFDEKIKGKDFDQAQIYYYKYYAANVLGEDISIMRENVEKIKEVDPDNKSLYLPLLAEISLNEQKYDDMLSYANELSEFNCESPYVYLYKSVAYRFKGDLTKAAKACNDGLEVNPSDSLINYQMGIINLLMDKPKEALANAQTAYESADTANAYISAASLFYLCAGLQEDNETMDAIDEELSYYGFTLATEVEKVLTDEMTIEDIFTSGKGDFTWAQ